MSLYLRVSAPMVFGLDFSRLSTRVNSVNNSANKCVCLAENVISVRKIAHSEMNSRLLL